MVKAHSAMLSDHVGEIASLATLVVPVELTLPTRSVNVTLTFSVPSLRLETSMPPMAKLPLGPRMDVLLIVSIPSEML